MKDLNKNIFLIVLFFMINTLHAIDGNLDASFNGNGLAALLESDSSIKSIAVQVDGKIVAAGYSDHNGRKLFSVFRYNVDGTIDKSFGVNGRATTRFGAAETNSCAHSLVIQDDGKIVVGGYTDAIKNSQRWCLARYNANGSLDESFYGGRAIFKGTVITCFAKDTSSQLNALALSEDGKIVAAGTSYEYPKNYFAVARYNYDGSLDQKEFNPEGNNCSPGTVRTSFGGDKNDDQAYAIAIQPNGKIVVGGSSLLTGTRTFALARYNINGALDKSFFSPGYAYHNGTVVTNFMGGETEGVITALVIQPDGKIVAAGSSNCGSFQKEVTRFALARYDNRGILDPHFGGYGLTTLAGTVISSFGLSEGASKINALALQPNGKLLAAGYATINGITHFALARYTSNGDLDSELSDGSSPFGKIITQLGRKSNQIFALALQSNGNILAAGTTDIHGRPQGIIARYSSKNSLIEPEIIYPADNSITINGSAIEARGTSQNPAILKIYLDENLVASFSVKGNANSWRYQLPPLTSGSHTVKVAEHYAGGRVDLTSQPITLIVDQHPLPINAMVTTCGLNPVSGILDACGASGNYTFAITSATNGIVTLNADVFTFTPTVASGQGSFTFRVTDSLSHCNNEGTVTIIINEMPSTANEKVAICQDTQATGELLEFTNAGTPPFIYTLVNQSDDGVATLNANGAFTFTPHNGFHGVAKFQYQITDANGCTSEPLTMSVFVYETPKAQDEFFTIYEDQLLVGNLLRSVHGGTPPYNFELIEPCAAGIITLEQDGRFSVIPLLRFNGTLSFKYQVTDIRKYVSNVATVTINVLEPIKIQEDEVVVQNDSSTPNEVVEQELIVINEDVINNVLESINVQEDEVVAQTDSSTPNEVVEQELIVLNQDVISDFISDPNHLLK